MVKCEHNRNWFISAAIRLIKLILLFTACLASPAQHRWTLVPDSDGRMHLMDLNPVDADMVEIEPMFTPETDTAFLLFTRNNRNAAQRLTRDANAIRASNFNVNWPVRLLIHGFNSGPSSGVNTATTTSYLNRGDFNVIVVDWSIGAATINYVTARNRVPQVGTVIASFLDFLVQNGFTNLNRVFIAGHSLGAHIAGITGKRVTSGRIQAIFGLDPAGPLFSIGAPNDRFAPGDAVYTEGIVTNGGNLGFDQPIATANFYPNWGTSQPGVSLSNFRIN